VATVNDGTNPGRQGATPQRQSSAGARHGHGDAGPEPTAQRGQLPDEIFGFSQSYSTGAPGSSPPGARSSDVTIQPGQLDDGLSHVTGDEITSTGLHGSAGAANSNGGPDGVDYTDPFGYMGNEHRESHTSAHIDGVGDWTQANDDGYAGGATLPALEGNRPVSTGIGSGHVHARHPNAGS
jgi:hypothetical protein